MTIMTTLLGTKAGTGSWSGLADAECRLVQKNMFVIYFRILLFTFWGTNWISFRSNEFHQRWFSRCFCIYLASCFLQWEEKWVGWLLANTLLTEKLTRINWMVLGQWWGLIPIFKKKPFKTNIIIQSFLDFICR